MCIRPVTFFVLLLAAYAHVWAQDYEPAFVDDLNLFDISRWSVPWMRYKILETENEVWWYVPKWHDLRALARKGECEGFVPMGDRIHNNLAQLYADRARKLSGKMSRGKAYKGKLIQEYYGLYRPYSPIVVYDKKDRQWRSLGLCFDAAAIYPVLADPFDPHLIWIGCNDGRPEMHADYAVCPLIFWFGAPLSWGGKRGGLGVVNVSDRTVRYYGPYLHLVDARVYEILFEKEAVWVWGMYPAGGGPNGLSRFDRKTALFSPLVLDPCVLGGRWWGVKLSATAEQVHVKVYQDFNIVRWNVDKETHSWELPRHVWAAKEGVALRETPSETAKATAVVSRTDHFTFKKNKEGQRTFGHALAVLGTRGDWLRVITSDDVVGWVKRQDMQDTAGFLGQLLENYATIPADSRENHWFLIRCMYYYMSEGEVAEAVSLLRAAAEKQNARVKQQMAQLSDLLAGYLKGGPGLKQRFQRRADGIRQKLRELSSVDGIQK